MTQEGCLKWYAIRYFNIFLNKVDKKIDLRKLNAKLKDLNIPFHIAPISHWYVDTVWQLDGLLKRTEFPLWYPWGRFEQHVKDSYNPRRWGGWFWIFEWGSRG